MEVTWKIDECSLSEWVDHLIRTTPNIVLYIKSLQNERVGGGAKGGAENGWRGSEGGGGDGQEGRKKC